MNLRKLIASVISVITHVIIKITPISHNNSKRKKELFRKEEVQKESVVYCVQIWYWHRPMAHPMVFRYLSYFTTFAERVVNRQRQCPAFDMFVLVCSVKWLASESPSNRVQCCNNTRINAGWPANVGTRIFNKNLHNTRIFNKKHAIIENKYLYQLFQYLIFLE